MTFPPLDPHSRVVDNRQRWTPEWYRWISEFSELATAAVSPVGIETPGWVNVMDFGAVGDGSSHPLWSIYLSLAEAQVVYPFVNDLNPQVDWCAIQQAIDTAFSERKRVTYMPSGTYVTNYPIYLDAPNNLRGTATLWSSATTYAIGNVIKWNGVRWTSQQNSNTNRTPGTDAAWWLPSASDTPTEFTFSLALVGDFDGLNVGTPSTHVRGSVIQPTGLDFAAVWSGPGQHMQLYGLMVHGPSAQSPTGNQNGAGFAIAGGSGGASHTLVQGCTVFGGFYRGFAVGLNTGILGDSNTFIDCNVGYCYKAFDFLGTQNYINSIINCRTNFCKYSVLSTVSKAVHIIGGNFSAAGMSSGTPAISSVVATDDGGPNLDTLLTIVLTSAQPDLDSGRWDRFVLDTDHFGPVPLDIISWTPGTLTLTAQVGQVFARNLNRLSGNPSAEFAAELEAATILYAAEAAVVFFGSGFHVRGLHIENPNATTTFYYDSTGFSGDQTSTFEDIFFNYETTLNGTGNLAQRLCQRAHPFVFVGGSEQRKVSFKNTDLQGATIDVNADQVYVEFDTPPPMGLVVRTLMGRVGPSASSAQITDNNHTSSTYGHGAAILWPTGWYDTRGPLPTMDRTVFDATRWRRFGDGACPHLGYRPAPWVTPKITPAMVEQLAGTLPTVGTYPLLHGEATYSVSEWDQGASALLFARSRHNFYSYGQSLTVDWEYRSTSNVVHVSDISLFFPGLGIILDNGDGDVEYVVTGVFPRYAGVVFDSGNGGYITVIKSVDTNDSVLVGAPATNYTGSTIKQAPYLFTFMTGDCRLTKTSDYTVRVRDCGMQFDNAGAGGAVVFSLPVVTAALVGLRYSFCVLAAQSLTVDAPASTTIRIAGSVSAASGNISASTIGDCVEIEAVSTTEWVAKSHEGTWTVT